MNYLRNNLIFEEALSLATMQPPLPLGTNADLELQLRTFAIDVFPTVFVMDRGALCELYGNLRRCSLLLQSHAISAHRTWPSQHRMLIQTSALFSGLLFLCDTWVKKELRKSKELVPMMSASFHEAIYFNSDVEAAL